MAATGREWRNKVDETSNTGMELGPCTGKLTFPSEKHGTNSQCY
jgi:hypothetical protein